MAHGLHKAVRSNTWRVQRRVPRDLMYHPKFRRSDGRPHKTPPLLEVHLHTADYREAKRLGEKQWAEWSAMFDRLRANLSVAEELREDTQKLVTVWTFNTLRDEPWLEPTIETDISDLDTGRFLKPAIEHFGVDLLSLDEDSKDRLESGVYLGMSAGLALFRKGIVPQGAPPMRRWAGPAPDRPAGATDDARDRAVLTLSGAVDVYARSGAQAIQEKTIAQTRSSVRLFQDLVGDIPVREVSARQASDFRDTLRQIDPGYRRDPDLKHMTLQAILEKYPARPNAGLSRDTILRHLSMMRGLFRVLVADGHMPKNHPNPFEGVTLSKTKRGNAQAGQKVRPLTDQEVKKLLDGAPELPEVPQDGNWKGPRGFRQSVRAAVLLGAYAGLRLSESASIRPQHVYKAKGGWFIIKVGEGKTESAVRRVALPKHLSYLGTYLKRCPEGPIANPRKFSEEFAAFRRKCEIPDKDEDGREAQYRSLRKSFRSKLAAGEVYSDTINCVIGHAREFGAVHYSPDGPDDRQRGEAADKVVYG